MSHKEKNGHLFPAWTLHPNDPRVAETTSIAVFEEAMLSKQFQAVVLHRYENPEDSPLHHRFKKIWDKEAHPRLPLNESLKAHISQDGHITFKGFPYEYLTVRHEFEAMLRTYHKAINLEHLEIRTNTTLDFIPHTHDFEVLNCTWLSKNGTGWRNDNDELQHVPASAWFFFRRDFMHESPENHPERLTNVVMPDLSIYK